jgi:hypothetical protein
MKRQSFHPLRYGAVQLQILQFFETVAITFLFVTLCESESIKQMFLKLDEQLPDDGWELIKHSLEGDELTSPFIAIRRRKHSGKNEHLTKVDNR